ncbi:MAG: NAD(P)/FAD-dependent oxidoreductase [Hyphomicrobiales bacterium]
MAQDFELIVIGAGIAGAAVAAHLAETRKVLIVDMEERPGFHSTGRSAAAFEPNYGPAPIRALTRAARDFFENPPQGFAGGTLVAPRQTIFLAPSDQQAGFETLMREQQGMREISLAAARAKFPLLRDGYAAHAVLDPGTADLDVDLLHRGYLRLFKSRGGTLVCNAGVRALDRPGGLWTVETPAGLFHSPIVVNAAGAWGDRVAGLAGAKPVGLQPKRRSIAVVPAPKGHDPMQWPLIGDVGETWYAKPQSGKLLVSPADATPVDPHDAYADDMALAEGIDRFQQATTIEVTRVEHTWGGLRSFAPDGNPVCGYDPIVDGFFWLVGQGGYGIQTAPSLSRLAAALAVKAPVPQDILAAGCDPATLSPRRFHN